MFEDWPGRSVVGEAWIVALATFVEEGVGVGAGVGWGVGVGDG